MAKQISKQVLIATLGRSSQVGTRTFDQLFFKQGIPLTKVVWIHGSEVNAAMRESVARVRYEVEHYYKKREDTRHIEFEFVTIKDRDGNCPFDTRTREDAEAVMYTLYEQLSRWKAAGYAVHLSISGGAKLIPVFGMAAAQLLFDSDRDKCWHLVSQDQVARRSEMHLVPEDPRDEVRLIDVPVLRWKMWKEWPTGSLAGVMSKDPLHAQEVASQLNGNQLFQWRCEFVKYVLRKDERLILEKLSLLGWENDQIDDKLTVHCKNIISRIWREYCDFIIVKASESGCAHQEELRDLDAGRLRRGRLIADFHLVFRHLNAQKAE